MLDFGYYNIDCMDGMKQFPDKYFELAIVDPPYGDGGVSGQVKNGLENGSTDTEVRPRTKLSLNMGGWKAPYKWTQKGTASSGLVEHGRRSSEKNHSVGCCAGTRIF